MAGDRSAAPLLAVAGGRDDDAATLAGLDALELAPEPVAGRGRRIWSAVWPKLAAVAIVLGLWELVALSGWKPDYLLPGPGTVLSDLGHLLGSGDFYVAVSTTMRRALAGFALAVVIGSVLGVAVCRVNLLRSAVGSLVTGLQTMPSIAWFPLAILLFGLSEGAMLFVVILGAAPSIANGLITGVDYVPPLLLRSGRMLGARGFGLYRHVVLPASLPSYVAGLKQGWAFAWRSLMAGELLVPVAHVASIGVRLENAEQFLDARTLLAFMIVILVLGIVVDALFGLVNQAVRRRWGVIDPAR